MNGHKFVTISCRENAMRIFRTVIAGAMVLLSLGLGVQAQQKEEPREWVAPMTEPVIRARLAALGYKDIQITRPNTLPYRIRAKKDGKPVVLHLHPQTGEVRDVTPGKPKTKPWIMPLEPTSTKVEPHTH
jgi:hypothetical protein